MNHICPVCGYPDLKKAAYFPSGEPSYQICPSCYYQYGKDDADSGISFEQWRKQWIENGMPWMNRVHPLSNWDPKKQLENIGVYL